jgi:hypothetical protein
MLKRIAFVSALLLVSGTSLLAQDADLDLIADAADNCPLVANPDQSNYDNDLQGDVCDDDDDNDGVLDVHDERPYSDTRPYAYVRNCNTGRPNVVFPNGLTINDRLTDVVAQSTKQSELNKGIREISDEAVDLGLITKEDKRFIHLCSVQVR